MPRRSGPPSFLLDENICGPDIAADLRALSGWTIERHNDYLGRGVSDVTVVKFCADRGWVLLTSDIAIRFTDEARAVIRERGVQTFTLLLKKNANGVQIRSALVAAQAKMLQVLRRCRIGFTAHVYLGGQVKVMEYFDPIALDSLSESQRDTIRRYGLKAAPKRENFNEALRNARRSRGV